MGVLAVTSPGDSAAKANIPSVRCKSFDVIRNSARLREYVEPTPSNTPSLALVRAGVHLDVAPTPALAEIHRLVDALAEEAAVDQAIEVGDILWLGRGECSRAS